jgi:hypothetical protein
VTTADGAAGPTAEQRVDGVFAALDKMTNGDLMTLSGAWTGGDADLRKDAWTRVKEMPKKDASAALLDQSRDRVARWVNDLGITWAGAYDRSIVVPAGADQGNLRRNVVPAILDALAAEIFTDLLTDDERDELLAPLRAVTDPERVRD